MESGASKCGECEGRRRDVPGHEPAQLQLRECFRLCTSNVGLNWPPRHGTKRKRHVPPGGDAYAPSTQARRATALHTESERGPAPGGG